MPQAAAANNYYGLRRGSAVWGAEAALIASCLHRIMPAAKDTGMLLRCVLRRQQARGLASSRHASWVLKPS